MDDKGPQHLLVGLVCGFILGLLIPVAFGFCF